MTVTTAPALLPLQDGEQYRFVFDTTACIGCHSCEVACAEQNDLPVDVSWRRVGTVEGGSYPATRQLNLSMACNHCVEPACLEGCPTGAYVKLADGIVAHHAEDCIGCQYCMWTCPYSVPVFHAGRKIVTKCDMCRPRLEKGQSSACVDACPTNAIRIEPVNVAAWRDDPRGADAPGVPSAAITLSTTRIILPDNLPSAMLPGDAHDVRPEHAHWPLLVVTLLMQAAMGVTASVLFTGGEHRALSLVTFVATALGMAVSLFHLGRPIDAWKAVRGIRTSWLSREVVTFAVFTVACCAPAVWPSSTTATVAFACGLAATCCSARLYMVPGRPAWNTRLTVAAFALSGLALGPLFAATTIGNDVGLRAVSVVAVFGQVAVLILNTLRLGRRDEREWAGSAWLLTGWFRGLLAIRVAGGFAGAAAAATGWVVPAVALVAIGEVVGRYLFYVSVVPMNMPGSFHGSNRREVRR